MSLVQWKLSISRFHGKMPSFLREKNIFITYYHNNILNAFVAEDVILNLLEAFDEKLTTVA